MYLKVFTTLPCLLLQKPSGNSKAKDRVKNLEERLQIWNEGNIEKLILYARTVQNRFRNSTNFRPTHEDSAPSFAKLKWKGKVNVALKISYKDYDNGVLAIDKKSS